MVNLMAEENETTEEDVNAHIQDINKVGNDENMDDVGKHNDDKEEEEEEEVQDEEGLPKKKKKRKDKKRSKDKESASILKPSRFTQATTVGKQSNLGQVKQLVEEKRKGEWGNYNHTHKRAVVVCSVVCCQDGTEPR
jgi:hypothetical protein